MHRMLLGFCFGLSLFSCSSMPGVQTPDAEVVQVKLAEPTLTDALLVFSVNVNNPNRFPLKIQGISYDLKLNDEDFLKGDITEKLEIAAGGESTLSIPIRVNYKDLLSGATSITRVPSPHYSFEGRVNTGFWKIPIKKAGEIRLPDAARLLR